MEDGGQSKSRVCTGRDRGYKLGDSLGVTLKGSRKNAICWKPGGSEGSFGTRGWSAKLTVNTNNQKYKTHSGAGASEGERAATGGV